MPSLWMPISRPHVMISSRAWSRCGDRVRVNGTSNDGSMYGSTIFGVLENCLSRCGMVLAIEPSMVAADMPSGSAVTRPLFMYRDDRMCHSWPPACQSCRPFT